MKIRFTPSEFLEKLYLCNELYKKGEISILSDCIKPSQILFVQDMYGITLNRADNLLKNNRPTVASAINKTEYFKNLLYSKSESYRKGNFEIVGEYVRGKDKILVKDAFGVCAVACNDLLKGFTPCIRSSIDKNTYFKNKVYHHNEYYRNGEFEITGEFLGMDKKIEIKNKYGCLVTDTDTLLNNYRPNVMSAVDRETYTIRKNRDFVPKNNRKYTSSYGKRFFYSLKFERTGELFFKIGITKNLEKRIERFPVDYTITVMYREEMDWYGSFDLEQRFLKEFKQYKYSPDIKFDGYTECLTTDPVSEYMTYY